MENITQQSLQLFPHLKMAKATRTRLLLTILFLCSASAEPVADKQALLDFLRQSPPVRPLNWLPTTPVCGVWTGVTCSPDLSHVIALRLPGIGLGRPIPPNTLSRLTALQTLSLRSNALSGPFPPDLLALTSLTGLHLQFNSFSGEIPATVSNLSLLSILDLSFNNFTGPIPASINNLTQLTALNLSNNSLSGDVPDISIPGLQLLNVSNNHLTGTIPQSLSRFPNSSFSGNELTPAAPLPLPPLPSSSPPVPIKKKLSESVILGIVVGGCALLFVVIAVIMLLCYSRGDRENVVSGKLVKGGGSPEKAATGSQDGNRLVFFEGCNYGFDLEDLLRASAEVLGKGTFGTAYKAVLEDATTVVVKRLKEVGVGKREFEQQMEVVGGIRHENVVELRAYYYSKDEKLMVCDYYTQGSVSALIHGKRGEARTLLDWETRLRIALGAARGVERIHTENSGKLVHGNIKSSNVFLNDQQYGCVSDLGLTPLMNQTVPRVSRTAGYCAPEVVDMRRSTQASDVYSLGVLILELLTGKSPIQITGGGDEVVHLVRWVQSVVREEWTAEVFDVELMRIPNIEEEMVELLQIAMACVVRMPEQRPKTSELVRMIEDVRRLDNTTDQPSTEADESTPVQAATATPSPLQ